MSRSFSPSTLPSRAAAMSTYPMMSRPWMVARNASERSSVHFRGTPSRFDSDATTYSSP